MIVATAKASNTKSVGIDQRAVVQKEEEEVGWSLTKSWESL